MKFVYFLCLQIACLAGCLNACQPTQDVPRDNTPENGSPAPARKTKQYYTSKEQRADEHAAALETLEAPYLNLYMRFVYDMQKKRR